MRITLKTLYEIIYDAEKHMKDTLRVQKNFLFLKSFEGFKIFTRQINRFTRDKYFYLTPVTLNLSRIFLSIYSAKLRKVNDVSSASHLIAKVRNVEILISELLERLETFDMHDLRACIGLLTEYYEDEASRKKIKTFSEIVSKQDGKVPFTSKEVYSVLEFLNQAYKALISGDELFKDLLFLPSWLRSTVVVQRARNLLYKIYKKIKRENEPPLSLDVELLD